MDDPTFLEGYDELLHQLKDRIRTAQLRAAFAVSHELVTLYWDIGRQVAERQSRLGWGEGAVRRLASDLEAAFPGVQGFSYRNLYRMQALYLAYPDHDEFVTQSVSQLPWGHNIVILQKLKNKDDRFWYAAQSRQYGWSRSVLEHQIATDLRQRHGKAITNFSQTLPSPQSDLAQQVLRDPYVFDFLNLGPDARERQLELGLLEHLRSFLLELGSGFAFVGSQFHIEVAGKDYYLDILFYHLRLRCFVVVDLKIGEFTPEAAGKMNFYLSAIDDQVRQPQDAPSIGLIICKTRDKVTVEYALRNTATPIGVAEFVTTLPPSLAGRLPTIEEMEAELTETMPQTAAMQATGYAPTLNVSVIDTEDSPTDESIGRQR